MALHFAYHSPFALLWLWVDRPNSYRSLPLAAAARARSAGEILTRRRAPSGCRVVSNKPPYKLATQFAEHALTLVPDVYLLLRLAFLESVSRNELLEHSGLRRVLVFRKRLPRMHRAEYDGPKASSSMAFAWM